MLNMSLPKKTQNTNPRVDQVEKKMKQVGKLRSADQYPTLPYREKCDHCKKPITKIVDIYIDKLERLICPECQKKIGV
jgi:hypothetical protein